MFDTDLYGLLSKKRFSAKKSMVDQIELHAHRVLNGLFLNG